MALAWIPLIISSLMPLSTAASVISFDACISYPPFTFLDTIDPTTSSIPVTNLDECFTLCRTSSVFLRNPLASFSSPPTSEDTIFSIAQCFCEIPLLEAGTERPKDECDFLLGGGESETSGGLRPVGSRLDPNMGTIYSIRVTDPTITTRTTTSITSSSSSADAITRTTTPTPSSTSDSNLTYRINAQPRIPDKQDQRLQHAPQEDDSDDAAPRGILQLSSEAKIGLFTGAGFVIVAGVAAGLFVAQRSHSARRVRAKVDDIDRTEIQPPQGGDDSKMPAQPDGGDIDIESKAGSTINNNNTKNNRSQIPKRTPTLLVFPHTTPPSNPNLIRSPKRTSISSPSRSNFLFPPPLTPLSKSPSSTRSPLSRTFTLASDLSNSDRISMTLVAGPKVRRDSQFRWSSLDQVDVDVDVELGTGKVVKGSASAVKGGKDKKAKGKWGKWGLYSTL
ncbi:hypothetical protein HK102_005731 [Quaeritorhiza haematococci]|nr:hypothetical protein HK102_005731 [Quaeritorhiza haematococci]